ncbi:MAG: AAA family ATPase [Peptostreptococcaceae bacterium]|nr:AAA family ATPase [Peptostreptococcaceae bacterium]
MKRKLISTELNHILEYPLTVAVAAMGYGKTTSARDFLQEENVKYVCVSIESDESSPQYIWDSLLSQLVRTKPEIGKQLRALGFPVNMPQRDKVLRIIEDHTYMTNTVLVIDDYHFAHAPELDKLIEQIVRLNIDGFHILILSRTTPEISIDELILKGYCYLIKYDLFVVSIAEIKKYFKLNGYDISIDTAKQVYDISEGWISAVYLIMQRYAEIGRVETGSSIEKLIETSVMSRYTAREVLILKSLCILDLFTPQQAAYVTDDMNCQSIMKKLSYGNSFIYYDEQNDIYRIHNILNNYLKRLLAQQPGNIKLNDLYKRSGLWCIQNGDNILGLKFLLKAEEFDIILMEFEKSCINILMDNNPAYILEIFEQIPVEVKYRHPIGYLAYIGFYVTNVNQDVGACLLSEIEQYYENDNSISSEMKRCISGEIVLIRAYIGFNDAALMHERLMKAHEILGGHSSIANKDKIITFGSPHALYLYYREKGKLLWTRKCVEEMFTYYTEMSSGCGKGFDDLLRAEYCLETGDLDGADIYGKKAIYKARTLGQISVIISSTFTLARVFATHGKFNEALKIMDDLSEEVETENSPILSSAFDLCVSYIGGVTRKTTCFAIWIKSGDIGQSEVLYQGMGFNYIVYGKYLLLKNDFIRLEVLCEEMQRAFFHFNNLLGSLHAYILDAISKYNLYCMENAKDSILSAIEIGKKDDIVLPFAEYGIYILQILKEIQRDTGKDEYIDRLVVCASQYSANLKNVESKNLAFPILTNREKEILESVVEGKTNREIATEIFTAEVTVRKNITSIYRKLGVNGRASAVKRAIELKIIQI